MKKDYLSWHYEKTKINEQINTVLFNERDIWTCSLGLNIGFEQDGKGESFSRPVIIIRKFNERLCWVVPLSKTLKNTRYYFLFSFLPNIKSAALLSQIRLIDIKRLEKRIGYISNRNFHLLIKKLKALLP